MGRDTVKIDSKLLDKADKWGKKQTPKLNKKQVVEIAVLKLVNKPAK